jgi:hypothetical protein
MANLNELSPCSMNSFWNDSIPKPVSVRYGFHSWAEASLFNTEGLPASSFRTDNWSFQ